MNHNDRTRILQEVVKIISVEGNEKEVADYLQNLLEAHSIKCEQVEFATGRNQLIAVLKGNTSNKTLGFSGHMDVVPIGEQEWKFPPFSGTVSDGKLYGRGAADTKGGLVAAVLAMIELKESGTVLSGDIKLLATVAEETGGLGSEQLTKLGYADDLDALIIAEPTNLGVGIGHKGAFWVRFTTKGKTAHGSSPQFGINAIEHMIILWQAFKNIFENKYLDQSNGLLGHPSMSLDVISGGKATNVVPDQCVIEIDIRTIPEINHEDLKKDISELLDNLKKSAAKIEAEVDYINDLAAISTEEEHVFTQIVSDAVKKETAALNIGGLSGYTDGSQFIKAKQQFPIIILGPKMAEMAHQPDEYVELESLHQCIDIFKEIAINFFK